MNWLDVVLLVILAWSIAASFRKGLTREVVGLVTVVLALILGIWLYGTGSAVVAPYVSSRPVANFLGFAAVFVIVMLLGSLASFVLGRFLHVTGLSIVDHALGAAFGAVRGTLIAVALILGIMAFAPGGRPPNSVSHSRTAPYVAGAARLFASVAPHELKEGYRKTYAETRMVWKNAVRDSKPASVAEGKR